MFVRDVTPVNRQTIGLVVALTVLLSSLLSTAAGSVRAAPAYTEVGGPIISDTTWTLANSPYIVVANVEVWQSVTLTIQPGVVVKFNKDKLLQVNGTLVAGAPPPIRSPSPPTRPARQRGIGRTSNSPIAVWMPRLMAQGTTSVGASWSIVLWSMGEMASVGL